MNATIPSAVLLLGIMNIGSLWAQEGDFEFLEAGKRMSQVRKCSEEAKKALAAAPAARFRPGAMSLEENSELPDRIDVVAERLSLFADFAEAEDDRVPLYLVNATGAAKSLSTQDSDLYVKLEYQSANGSWIRAQPHQFSWCGNSYYFFELPAGKHLKFDGYLPRTGEPCKVRYRRLSHDGYVSNVGEGHFLVQDREAVALDELSAQQIPQFLVPLLDDQDIRLYINHRESQYVAALRLLSLWSDSRYYRRRAAWFRDTLPVAAPERAEIDAILAREWPARPEPLRFAKMCWRLMIVEDAAAEKPLLQKHPGIVRSALRWVISENGDRLHEPGWKELHTEALARER